MSVFNTISDLYKEVYGSRPSSDWMCKFNETSVEEQQEIYENLCEDLEFILAQEEQDNREASLQFEDKIEKLMHIFNLNREDVLRWMIDSVSDEMGAQKEAGYVCFLLDIPYNYEAELKVILQNME